MRSVKVISPDGVGFGTTVVDTETGAEIHGARRLVITTAVDDLTVIEVEFVSGQFEVNGSLRPMCIDPATGELREVSRIVFADGTDWTA